MDRTANYTVHINNRVGVDRQTDGPVGSLVYLHTPISTPHISKEWNRREERNALFPVNQIICASLGST